MTVEDRLNALEARVRELEDRAQIFQLMAAYGPAVDSRDGATLADLWTEDASYDTDGYIFDGRKQITELVDLPTHQDYVAAGSAHVISMPHLTIHGDSAVATGYSRVYLGDGNAHKVARTSANRWVFERTADGWKVKYRVNRRLTGKAEARALLNTRAAAEN